MLRGQMKSFQLLREVTKIYPPLAQFIVHARQKLGGSLAEQHWLPGHRVASGGELVLRWDCRHKTAGREGQALFPDAAQ